MIAISVISHSYSQNSKKDTVDFNPQFGFFAGGGYDYFAEGSEYDQGGAGGTRYKKHMIDHSQTKGFASNIGLQFKIPFNTTTLLSLEGSGLVSSHKIEYVLSEGAFGDGSKRYSNYNAKYFSTRFSGIIEKRFGKNLNYYLGIGPYGLSNYRQINTKGTDSIHTFDSGTPSAPATIYSDTTIYNNNIKTNYKTEFGLTILAGFIIPATTKTKIFIEARALAPFRDSINDPNLKIYHFVINAGLLWNINF